jgi:hypothetical protein
MKVIKQHLFLILLLLTVIFCCGLGIFRVVEGMQNKQDIKEMRNRNNNRNNNNRNNDYTPQSGISGNEYTGYTPAEGSDGLVRVISTDDGRVVYATPQNTVNGIPGRSIPPGQEDLYILKSQVVPPVCPACPTIINKCTGKEKCPPCPPCGRCPEASFECVKRPTYKADNPYLPVPVLSDFSSFGM